MTRGSFECPAAAALCHNEQHGDSSESTNSPASSAGSLSTVFEFTEVNKVVKGVEAPVVRSDPVMHITWWAGYLAGRPSAIFRQF